ncbi:MAG: peptidoglycan synthetase FtsI, partial [Frankiales bacterium]|nr:peptidoglycan synthetase FtsI [Frankiales bacterium]
SPRPVGHRPARPPRPARTPVLRELAAPRKRLHTGLVAVLVVLSLVGVRLVQLQGLTPAYADTAEQQRLRKTVLNAPRGEITDRNGQALAMSVQARAVYGEPRTIAKAVCPEGAKVPCDPASIALVLAPVLGVDAGELQAKLSKQTAFVYLARDLSPEVGVKVRELRLPGVGVLSEERRTHPAKDLAASVIGYTDNEGRGLGGIESAWNAVLAGKDGKAVAAVDKMGRVIPTGQQSEVEPVPGRDVQLTIDRDLQYYAQDLLAKEVAATEAQNGSVVVMDVKTGEVLALATAPTFDPDARQGVSSERLGNPAVRDVYEPGSVAKLMTASGALEAGVVSPQEVLTVPSTIDVKGKTFHDSHAHKVERLTFAGVLAQSSNVGTIQVAERLGPQRLHDIVDRFGYGKKVGIGLPGESRGVLPAVPDWSNSSLPTIAIGQGVSGTVLNALSVYQTIANDGVRITPTIVRSVVDTHGTPEVKPHGAATRIVSPEVAAQVRSMLEGVVTAEGTGELAAVPGYRIAGKTGTAQRVVDGRYVGGNYTSSFIGFAPADAPRLVTAVVLQGTGKKGYYGGSTAGPVFQGVMSAALRMMKVPPTGTVAPVPCLVEGCPR